MTVTITNLRKDLFRIVDQSLAGEPVEFVHKGVVFHIVPEVKGSKLAKLIGHQVTASGADLDEHQLLPEMEAEWREDWSDL